MIEEGVQLLLKVQLCSSELSNLQSGRDNSNNHTLHITVARIERSV